MSSKNPGKKIVSRRSFLNLARNAAGVVAAGALVGEEVVRSRRKPRVGHAPPAPEAAPTEATAGSTASTSTASAAVDANLPPATTAELDLLSPVKPGTVYRGWKVVSVHGVHLGAVPVVMEDRRGDRFQVDVCLRDRSPKAPKAVADTARLSFFLANSGDGSTPSAELHGLGAIALAVALGRRGGGFSRPAGLMTLRQRMKAYPDGAYSVPV